MWILDRQTRRYWALDHYFRVITADQEEMTIAAPAEDDFQPETGPPRLWSRRLGRGYSGVVTDGRRVFTMLHEMAHAWVNVTYFTDEEYEAEVAARDAAHTDNDD